MADYERHFSRGDIGEKEDEDMPSTRGHLRRSWDEAVYELRAGAACEDIMPGSQIPYRQAVMAETGN